MYIKISVNNKIATLQDDVLIVNGNSDYVIQFTFDAEWEPYETKTARFVTARGYTDVVFSGNEVALPVITDAISVRVGVYAGNLHTTTPAVIFCRRSITDGSGSPVEPTPDVYAQIMERLNNLDGATPATAEKLGVVKIGDNLKITEDGVLSVDTADAVAQDNTRPITSAAVYTAKSNIEALLGNLSELKTEAKNNLVAAINEAAQSGGGSGEYGGYYTPAVTQPTRNTMQVVFTPSKTTMPAVDGTEITLPDGPRGADGKSAYQYAQEGGYTGTEAEFATKLAAEIPTALPNPNALTFTGAVTGSYNGSAAMTVNIPSAVTDDHINSLIDTKLGVIENGTY